MIKIARIVRIVIFVIIFSLSLSIFLSLLMHPIPSPQQNTQTLPISSPSYQSDQTKIQKNNKQAQSGQKTNSNKMDIQQMYRVQEYAYIKCMIEEVECIKNNANNINEPLWCFKKENAQTELFNLFIKINNKGVLQIGKGLKTKYFNKDGLIELNQKTKRSDQVKSIAKQKRKTYYLEEKQIYNTLILRDGQINNTKFSFSFGQKERQKKCSISIQQMDGSLISEPTQLVFRIFVDEMLIETIKKNVMTDIKYKFFTKTQFQMVDYKQKLIEYKDDSSNGQKWYRQQKQQELF